MNSEPTLDQLVSDFCRRIFSDFREIKAKLEQLHPEWAPRDLAVNLMEFGRGLISQVGQPSERDVQFMKEYIASLGFGTRDAAFFSAYSAGCLLGLVVKKELRASDLGRALELSARLAQTRVGEED